MKITIAVDAMSGDYGLEATVPAAAKFLARHPDAQLIMVGQQEPLERAIVQYASEFANRISVIHAEEVVGMDESPQSALKNKKNSSMRVAINLVKEEQAQAIVSAGNTGALMATARFVLKMLEHVDRPAIAKFMPSQGKKPACLLDLGANVDCSAAQLLQFAIMGSVLSSAVQDVPTPRIGLLNVGVEEIKGNEVVKEAYALLKQCSLIEGCNLNFIGNVEGDDIFKGDVDVVVCDGFVGNVALKSVEGAAKVFGFFLKQGFNKNLYSRFCALLAIPVLKYLKQQFDPRRYNGAIFLGLRGIVIKSHGGTDAVGFAFALQEAYEEIKKDVLTRVTHDVAVYMQHLQTAKEKTLKQTEEGAEK